MITEANTTWHASHLSRHEAIAAATRLSHVTPSHDQIRARAYQIWRERLSGDTPGDAVSDWLRAERDLDGVDACRQ